MNIPQKQEKKVINTNSAEETMKYAQQIAKYAKDRNQRIICLHGNLGAGKTTFVKGFAEAFGLNSKQIKSPTYTYWRLYKTKKGDLYHFDYYRINEVNDLIIEELRHILDNNDSYAVIEWPEKIKAFLPLNRLDIYFEQGAKTNHRILTITDHE